MYIISDDQWARESNGHIKVLRTRVIDVSYGLLKAWFNCPPVAPPPPVNLDGPNLDHHGHPQQQHPQQPPPIPLFRDFIHNAVHRTRTPLNAMVAAVYLVRRLRDRNPNCAGTSITPHRVMLAAIMLACKLLYDDTYSNRTWVHVSQGIFSLEEINRMEWEFLSYIKFEAAIARQDWIDHVRQMDTRLAEESRDLGMTPLQQELNLVAIDEDTRAMSPDEIAFIGQLSVQHLQHLHQLSPPPANQPAVSQSQLGQQPSASRMAGGTAPVSSTNSAEDVTSLPTAAEHGSSSSAAVNNNGSGSTRVTRSLSRKKSQAALAAASSASLVHGSSSSASAGSRQSTSSYPPQSHSAKVMPSMPAVAISDPVPRPNSAAAALAAHRSSSASSSSLPSTGSSSSALSWHQGSHSHGSLPSASTHHPHAHPHASHHHAHGLVSSVLSQPPPMGQQQYMHSAAYPPVSQHQHQQMYPPPAYPNSVQGNNNPSSSRTPMPAQPSSGSHPHHPHHHHGSAAASSGQQQHFNIPRPYAVAPIPPHHATSSSQSNGSGSGIPPPHQPQQGAWYPPPAWPAHSYPQQQPMHSSQPQHHMPPPPHVPAGHHLHQHGRGGLQTYAHAHPPAQMQPAHLVPAPPPTMPSSNARDVVPALVRARTGSNPATVGMPVGAPVSHQQQQQQQAAMLAAAAAAAAAAAGPLNKRGDSGTDLHALQQLHGMAGAAAAATAAQHAQYMHHHRGQAVSGALGGGMMGVTVSSGNAHGAVGGNLGSNGFGQ